MMRTLIYFFVLILITACANKTETKKPNILFIFADDQNAETLGVAGNPYIQTPTLDQLAKEGARFTNTYVMGGIHGAICMTSRSMLFSGKNFFKVGDQLKDVNTMTMDFAKAGYTTFGTGKWHNEKEAFEGSFQQAKNVYLGGMANHYAIDLRDFDSEGKLKDPDKKGYSTEIFAETAIEFIQSQKEEENPFFCYLAFTAPHDPYSPEHNYIDYYPDGTIPLPGNYMPFHPFQFDHLTVRDENLTGWPRKPEVIQMILSDYYALITHVDHQVERILQALEESGQLENTIIVYAADNGLAVGSHGLLGKQSLYEHSTKVPLIIKGPGVPQDQELDALVYLHDLFPTLAEMAGIPIPDGLDGKSLVPVIHGQKNSVREVLFTAYRHTIRAVRSDNWKLIRYPERDYTQLFDLEKDPLEINNLAENPSFLDQKEQLLSVLSKEQKEAGDTLQLTASVIQPIAYNPDTLKRSPDRWQPEYIIQRYFQEY
jgi:arylsulfatase A-like enzyme